MRVAGADDGNRLLCTGVALFRGFQCAGVGFIEGASVIRCLSWREFVAGRSQFQQTLGGIVISAFLHRLVHLGQRGQGWASGFARARRGRTRRFLFALRATKGKRQA